MDRCWLSSCWVAVGKKIPWSSSWRDVPILQMIDIYCCCCSQWPSFQFPSLPRLINITSLQQQLSQQRVLLPSSRVLTRSCSWRHSALRHPLTLAVVMLHHNFFPPPIYYPCPPTTATTLLCCWSVATAAYYLLFLLFNWQKIH